MGKLHSQDIPLYFPIIKCNLRIVLKESYKHTVVTIALTFVMVFSFLYSDDPKARICDPFIIPFPCISNICSHIIIIHRNIDVNIVSKICSVYRRKQH